MGSLSRLTKSELEQLLAGHAPAGENDLEPLAAFLRRLQAFAQGPDDETALRQIAAVADAAKIPAYSAVFPRGGRRRARPKVVIALALMSLLVFGGAAYGGALPSSVQGAVSDLADRVGISLPGNNNDVDTGPVGNLDNGDVNNGGAVGDAGDVNNSSDPAVGQVDGQPTDTTAGVTDTTNPPVNGNGDGDSSGNTGNSGDTGSNGNAGDGS